MKKLFSLAVAMITAMTIQAQQLTDLVADKYNGQVVVTVNGQSSDPNAANVEIVKKEGNKIDFKLKNFVLEQGGDKVAVGNVQLTDIALQQGETANEVKFQTSQTIQIAEGDADFLEAQGLSFWYGPYVGDIPVNLSGTATTTFANINIDIDMSGSLGQVINVVFSYGTKDGIESIKTNNRTADVCFNISGQRTAADAKGIIIKDGRKVVRK